MTLILFGVFAVLLLLGVPVAFSLGASALAAVLLGSDLNLAICAQRMYAGTASFSLLAIPFFILAGNLMSAGGVSRRLINLCNSLLGHITGGLSMVAIATCAFFAAISGSSIATAAAVGGIIIPEMIRQHYDRNFAAATVASSAELGVIIPPSIGLIMYCVATGESVSTIFIAGFVPGIMIALSLMAAAHFMSKKQGFLPSPKATPKEKVTALKDAVWALFLSQNKYVFLLLVNGLLLLVGLFCDAGAAIIILAPILAPVAKALGIDLIHFGIIMMTNLAVGMMTPPVGVNLYVVCDTAKVKIESMMKYLIVYFAVLLIDILLVTYIPAISLLLPRLMG